MGSNNGGEPSNRHACAACRHQRKKCEEDCVMGPYFPADREEDFKAVHKIFGVSNTSKLLMKHEDQTHRSSAAQSFIWEARMWRQDPVNGPLGKYRKLERENDMLRNALDQQQQKGCLALPSSTVEESIALVDIGNDSNNNVSGNSKDEVDGVIPIYGSAMNYGYANQNLAIDGSSSGTYTSLLQGQEVTERKGLVGNCVSAPNYQPAISEGKQVLSQETGFHQGAPIVPFDSFQYPMVHGGNGNYINNNNRPMQFQGRGRGNGATCLGPNMHGQARGQVVFDPSVGQGQARALCSLGSVDAQIGPNFGDNSPGHMRAIPQRHDVRVPPSYHHQHHPMHVQRQAMNQGQNHHNFQQYSLSNGQSYDNAQGSQS